MQAGDVLDQKYRLVRRIGQGGEGSVFLAVHLQTEEFRALKVLPNQPGAKSCHELSMLKNLHNRHLPQIIDVLEEEEGCILVMEYIRGTSLDRMLREGKRLTPAQTEEVLWQVTEVLCYLSAGQEAVCHLDIKPSNLIRSPDGTICLVDFGSAVKGDDAVRKGTDGYAAPEQYDGRLLVDARSDIYGLGATAWRLISGKQCPGVKQQGHVPNCPPELERIIQTCTRAEAEKRYQSPQELQAALLRLRRKRRREHARVQLLGALALALPAAAFCLGELPAALDLSGDSDWNYEQLLSRAPVTEGEEAQELYRRAVLLEPGRGEAYEQALQDAAADGIFSREEERFVRDLLHTVPLGSDRTNEELLAEDPQAYGRFAGQMGLVCWTCGEGEERRRIAGGWFRKAKESGADTGHLLSLCSELYESLTILEEESDPAKRQVQVLLYWNRSEEVLKAAKSAGETALQMELYKDLLEPLPFLAGDLLQEGITEQELTERVEQIVLSARDLEEGQADSKVLHRLELQVEEAGALACRTIEDLDRVSNMIQEESE